MILFDTFELKKTSKTPLVSAAVYRPDVLSFLSVPESKLSAHPTSTSRFLPKLSRHSGKNKKNFSPYTSEGQLHATSSLYTSPNERRRLFYVFSSRRGDFAEMMDVRGEGRGACSPELTHSQPSRHAVPTASTGVFIVFFQYTGSGWGLTSYFYNSSSGSRRRGSGVRRQ